MSSASQQGGLVHEMSGACPGFSPVLRPVSLVQSIALRSQRLMCVRLHRAYVQSASGVQARPQQIDELLLYQRASTVARPASTLPIQSRCFLTTVLRLRPIPAYLDYFAATQLDTLPVSCGVPVSEIVRGLPVCMVPLTPCQPNPPLPFVDYYSNTRAGRRRSCLPTLLTILHCPRKRLA